MQTNRQPALQVDEEVASWSWLSSRVSGWNREVCQDQGQSIPADGTS